MKEIADDSRIMADLSKSKSAKDIIDIMRYGRLSTNASYYFVDMEYCDESLETHIRGLNGPALVWVPDDDTSPRVSWDEVAPVMEICVAMAGGLAFLHRHHVIHGNL